jgi:hypothetical protein
MASSPELLQLGMVSINLPEKVQHGFISLSTPSVLLQQTSCHRIAGPPSHYPVVRLSTREVVLPGEYVARILC